MPDWKAIVRQRLHKIDDPEIIVELAAHLEDQYATLIASGISESEAEQRAMRQLDSACDIERKINLAKGDIVNHRSKALWLPGLSSFTASAGSLAILQVIAFHSHWALTNMTTSRSTWLTGWNLTIYLLWLAFQLPCGALAAWLSRRGGGMRLESITAGMFPSLIMLTVMSLGVISALVLEHNPYITSHWGLLAKTISIWVLLPGLGLLLGTVPFLSRREAMS